MSATASESNMMKKSGQESFFEAKSFEKLRDKVLMNALKKVRRNGKELGEEYSHMGIALIAAFMLMAMQNTVSQLESGEIGGGPCVNLKKQ